MTTVGSWINAGCIKETLGGVRDGTPCDELFLSFGIALVDAIKEGDGNTSSISGSFLQLCQGDSAVSISVYSSARNICVVFNFAIIVGW